MNAPLLARPVGHRWPGRVPVLPWDEHLAHLDYASGGTTVHAGGCDFSWKHDAPGVDAELREDELRALMEAVA